MAVSYQPDYLRVIAEQSAAARQRRAAAQNTVPANARVFIPEFAPARTSQAVQEQIVPVMRPASRPRQETTVSEPVQTTPAPSGPVQETPSVPAPAPAPAPTPDKNKGQKEQTQPEPTPYNVYDDPFYQQALQGAQSQFNIARDAALAELQTQQLGIEQQQQDRLTIAEDARRRLAGNYARRGMGRGSFGALSRAEAEANARELRVRTSLDDQLTTINNQFLTQFGAEGTDWLGTRAGYEAQQAAIQQALQNRLAGLTTVG